MSAGLRIPTFQVDAFSSKPFGGNPAAVCLLSPVHLPLSDSIRQKIAAEMNLSETAFLEPVAACGGSQDPFLVGSRFRLRWFTPATEVPLCGHATLASAAVLFSVKQNRSPSLEFETLSGVLTVKAVKKEGQDALEMDLPVKAPTDPLPDQLGKLGPAPFLDANPDSHNPLGAGPGLAALLKACAGSCPVKSVQYNAALKYLLVVLEDSCSRQDLEAVKPDTEAMLAAVGSSNMTGVIVTTPGSGPYDLFSRFFGPWAGIAEDPATGSAHAVLGPYWSARLGKRSLYARQCSPRGADVWIDSVGEGADRVKVLGQAALVLQGELLLHRQQ